MTAAGIHGLLLDIDGTLLAGDGTALPGAREAVGAMQRAGVPYLLATNTTRMPVRSIRERLLAQGIDVPQDRILSATRAAVDWLKARGAASVMMLLPDPCREDFAGMDLDAASPEYVVAGDLGRGWSFDVLQGAFRVLLGGAGLVAIQKNRYWNPGTGPTLDAGPFVAALEYAAGMKATLVGKPSPAFFATALARLGIQPHQAVMVGDSVVNDVAGAQAAGLKGVLVRGGGDPAQPGLGPVQPDAVLASIADLPAWLNLHP